MVRKRPCSATLFDTRVRYSGVSAIYAIGWILTVPLTPLVVTAIHQADNSGPWVLGGYVCGVAIISAMCAAAMKRVP
jgi:MHS family shikimate/dehydroshikimate transporter-like MFS transporter